MNFVGAMTMDLAKLKALVGALEGDGLGDSLVLPGLEAHLPAGGLTLAGWHEVSGPAGVADGFVLALIGQIQQQRPGSVLWLARQGELYAPGLAGLGCDPQRLLLACPLRDTDLLWALEEGLRSAALAAVVAETLAPIDAVAGRRLQLAAQAGRSPGFVLRLLPPGRTAIATHGSASTRWHLTPGPARFGADQPVGRVDAVWQAELLRVRGGRPGQWCLGWRDGAVRPLDWPASPAPQAVPIRVA